MAMLRISRRKQFLTVFSELQQQLQHQRTAHGKHRQQHPQKQLDYCGSSKPHLLLFSLGSYYSPCKTKNCTSVSDSFVFGLNYAGAANTFPVFSRGADSANHVSVNFAAAIAANFSSMASSSALGADAPATFVSPRIKFCLQQQQRRRRFLDCKQQLLSRPHSLSSPYERIAAAHESGRSRSCERAASTATASHCAASSDAPAAVAAVSLNFACTVGNSSAEERRRQSCITASLANTCQEKAAPTDSTEQQCEAAICPDRALAAANGLHAEQHKRKQQDKEFVCSGVSPFDSVLPVCSEVGVDQSTAVTAEASKSSGVALDNEARHTFIDLGYRVEQPQQFQSALQQLQETLLLLQHPEQQQRHLEAGRNFHLLSLVAKSHRDMGLLLHEQQKLDDAVASYQKALLLYLQLEELPIGVADLSNGSAGQGPQQHEIRQERRLAGAAAAANALDIASCLSSLGVAEIDRKNFARAESFLQQALLRKAALLNGVPVSCLPHLPAELLQQQKGQRQRKNEEISFREAVQKKNQESNSIEKPKEKGHSDSAAIAAAAASEGAEADRKKDQLRQLYATDLHPHVLYFETLNSLGGLWLHMGKLEKSLLALQMAEQCMYTSLELSSGSGKSDGNHSNHNNSYKSNLSTNSHHGSSSSRSRSSGEGEDSCYNNVKSFEAIPPGAKAIESTECGAAAATEEDGAVGLLEKQNQQHQCFVEGAGKTAQEQHPVCGTPSLLDFFSETTNNLLVMQQQTQQHPQRGHSLSTAVLESPNMSKTLNSSSSAAADGGDVPVLPCHRQFTLFLAVMTKYLEKSKQLQEQEFQKLDLQQKQQDPAAVARGRLTGQPPQQMRQRNAIGTDLLFYGTIVFFNMGQTLFALGRQQASIEALERAKFLAHLSGDLRIVKRVEKLLDDFISDSNINSINDTCSSAATSTAAATRAIRAAAASLPA